jgi:hypothetical protein
MVDECGGCIHLSLDTAVVGLKAELIRTEARREGRGSLATEHVPIVGNNRIKS